VGQDQLPVTISIIGTGTSEGGGVAPTPSGQVATTPGTQPDLIINVITPMMAILVRFVTLFLNTFVGALTAAGVGGPELLGATDFHGVALSGAWLSLSVAGVGLLKNLATVFMRLEGKYPIATGSI